MNNVQYLLRHRSGSKPLIASQVSDNQNADSEKPKRKKRSDGGIKRNKYDSNLPHRYRSYLARANKKSISFDLSVNDFNLIISKSCVYCGSSHKIGVDRIDSSLGYTIDNVQPCCGVCNLMKYTYDEEFFLKHVFKVFRHRNLSSKL